MNATGIEWVKNPDGTPGYTWNPITGCLNGCEYCYARKLANGRLKQRYLTNPNVAPAVSGWESKAVNIGNNRHILDARYLDPFYPRFWADKLVEPCNKTTRWGSSRRYTQKSKGIFVCDMSDLFGIGIPEDWTRRGLDTIEDCPQHRFYLLTKQPQNLIKFSPFPDNCWVGVTAVDYQRAISAASWLQQVVARVKFISFEPLLASIPLTSGSYQKCGVSWIVIGAMTCGGGELSKLSSQFPKLTPMPYGKRYTLQPKIEWLNEICLAATQANIPVFLKENLRPLFDYCQKESGVGYVLRQEMPAK